MKFKEYSYLKTNCIMFNAITIESSNHAPLFCMLALGKTGEGAYAWDHDISA